MDFECRLMARGLIIFQVQHRTEPWKTQLPIRVD